MIYNNPAVKKVIAPTISCFQVITKRIVKIKTGILCMNNPKRICPKLASGVITSNENKAKNKINKIENILGVQYKDLLIFFINLFSYVAFKIL